MRLLLALAALLLAVPPASVSAAHWWEAGSPLPKLAGRVVDQAKLLSPDQAADLTVRLAQLERTTGHQFVVLTVMSLDGQRIEDFGVRVGRTWGLGRKGVDDGVLLIVAPHERKMRIEVGYGLEKRLSDPLCAQIIRDDILPHFRANNMAAAIQAGTLRLIALLGNKPG